MHVMQTIGLVLIGLAAARYVALWIGLITSRESRPKAPTTTILIINFGGTLGASLYLWYFIPWWYIPLIHLGILVLVLIPMAIFRAR
jgi:hypothetical protein